MYHVVYDLEGQRVLETCVSFVRTSTVFVVGALFETNAIAQEQQGAST